MCCLTDHTCAFPVHLLALSPLLPRLVPDVDLTRLQWLLSIGVDHLAGSAARLVRLDLLSSAFAQGHASLDRIRPPCSECKISLAMGEPFELRIARTDNKNR